MFLTLFEKSYDTPIKKGVKSQLLTLVCAECGEGIEYARNIPILSGSGNLSHYFFKTWNLAGNSVLPHVETLAAPSPISCHFSVENPIYVLVVSFLDVLILLHELSSGGGLLCFKTTVKTRLL